jgi:hypothetical protein
MIANSPLFNGTIHLVDLAFRRKDQGGAITRLSSNDLATGLNYMTLAVPTIVRYTSQYGDCAAAVSSTLLVGQVDINSANYDNGWIENWVNTLAADGAIPSNDCICILNPPGIINTDNAPPKIGGYHDSTAHCRYMMINLRGTGLTVADRKLQYSQILSHEIAEMIVDPDPNKNPEVCDPCASDHTTLNFFMKDGSYVGNVTDANLPPVYDYLLEGIVQPAFSNQFSAPSAACGYFPEIWKRVGSEKFRELVTANYADNRRGLFALGKNRDIWRLDQITPGGPWGAWQSFGGHDLQELDVSPNADGRLEVFARGGDGALYHLWQTGPAGIWGAWESLGGADLAQIDVSSDSDGVLNVVALDSNGECFRICQTGPNADWGEWTSLGGYGFKLARSGAGLGGGQLFFVLDANQILYATTDPDQPDWQRVETPALQSFELIRGDDGRLHIAGLTESKTAVHLAQSHSGVDFEGWDDLAGHDLESLVAALNADGRLELFALGGNSKVFHRWQWNGGEWSEWAGLGVTQDVTFQQVCAQRIAGGPISAFGLLSDGEASQISQNAPNGSWV